MTRNEPITLAELARMWYDRSPLQHQIIVRNMRKQYTKSL